MCMVLVTEVSNVLHLLYELYEKRISVPSYMLYAMVGIHQRRGSFHIIENHESFTAH